MKRISPLQGILTPFFILLFFVGSAAQPTFINKIPIPPLLDAGQDTIQLEMRLLNIHQFNPADPTDTVFNGTSNQPGIETWSYNLAGDTTMTFLGPTLKWHTGEMTNITVTNLLPQPTTTHWHGAEVPAEMDGGPHQPIASNSSWSVNFTNLDSASTMWYHPHFHNNTYPQVQLGLSGMIISEQASDTIRESLPHTYGVDDIPVIIGDLRNNIYIDSLNIFRVDTTKGKHPHNIVNGLTNPYLEVPAHLIRLRILNGSTRKGLLMAVSDNDESISLVDMDPFILVATDGGYTLKPDTMQTLLTGPGARAEIILDLTDRAPGDTLYLRNLKDLMPNYVVGSSMQAPGGGGSDSTIGNAFLQLRVVADPPDYLPIDEFTSFTSAWDPSVQDTLGITRRRVKRLVKMPETPDGKSGGFTIDSLTYQMEVINDTVCVGAKETWTIHNTSKVAHPFHIHKIFFRILDIDSAGTFIDLESRGLNGPKDDVLVRPNWKLRFLAKFDDYPNAIDSDLGYMYHCHILTHEDIEGGGMMHQFVVTNEGPCLSVSVNDEFLRKEMVLFPNPAQSELYLMGESKSGSLIRFVDLQGRILSEEKLPPFRGNTPLKIDNLRPGFYFVSWIDSEGLRTQKVMIE